MFRSRPPASTPSVMHGESLITRRLVWGLAINLAVIGSLSGFSYVLMHRVISEQRESATVINAAGRQRMLSQRIALFALVTARADDEEARTELLISIGEMQAAHAALTDPADPSRFVTKLSPKLRAMYFEGPFDIDGHVRRYIELAQHVADDPTDQAAQTALAEQAKVELITRLDEATKQYEREAEQRVDRLLGAALGSLVATMLALAALGWLVFRPLVAFVQRTVRRLVSWATEDPLTGLLNRRAFFERCQRMSEAEAASSAGCAAWVIDLDHFKSINDRHGHAAGDAVLQEIGRVVRGEAQGVLQAGLAREIVAGRIGGDELALFAVGCTVDDARALAARLVAGMRTSGASAASAVAAPSVSISVGLHCAKAGSAPLDALFKQADTALYAAKTAGRNGYSMA